MKLVKQVIDVYLDRFKRQEGYFTADRSRHNYFVKHPANIDLNEIILKVSTVEDNEIHRHGAVKTVAQHILSLEKLDERLQAGDHRLVPEINEVKHNQQTLELYSFATRYCNGHNETHFPIYEKNIDLLLRHYLTDLEVSLTQLPDFSEYTSFVSTLRHFVSDTKIHDLNYQEIDKFLWIYGDQILEELEKKA